jgi:hypothetical protein
MSVGVASLSLRSLKVGPSKILLRTRKDVWTLCLQIRFGLYYEDLELANNVEGLVREALQEIVDCWNRFFVEAEEMNIDFCFYVSPFPSTMSTARPFRACP